MKKTYLLILVALGMNVHAQVVTIPDNNFKTALLSNQAINTNADNEIQVSEAAAYAGAIKVSGKSIADLTGIEAFVNIDSLDCSSNTLSTLNVSSNTALTFLNCNFNSLSSLNVSSNTALKVLLCNFNSLITLDLTANNALAHAECYYNYLTSLNTGSLSALRYLKADYNELATLNVTANANLDTLYISSNPRLVNLDISNNPALTDLVCAFDSLTSLNLLQDTSLTIISCVYNKFTTLDLSSCHRLVSFQCQFNSLTSLNLKNGNNTNMSALSGVNNPNLTCIQVDDPAYSSTAWRFSFDNSNAFSTNCMNPLSVNEAIPATDIHVYPNPAASALTIETNGLKLTKVTLYSIQCDLLRSQNVTGNKTSINIYSIPAGIYFLQTTSADGTVIRQKIVKE